MDDPRWIRIVIIGLILASLAVGYYLFKGATSLKSTKVQTTTTKTTNASPSPVTTIITQESSETEILGQETTQTNTPKSAYQTLAQRSQGSVQTLPKTGFPLEAVAGISAGAMLIGYGLKKFPN